MRAGTKRELNAFFKAKLDTAIAIGIQVVVLEGKALWQQGQHIKTVMRTAAYSQADKTLLRSFCATGPIKVEE